MIQSIIINLIVFFHSLVVTRFLLDRGYSYALTFAIAVAASLALGMLLQVFFHEIATVI